jgi:hypothetical protein
MSKICYCLILAVSLTATAALGQTNPIANWNFVNPSPYSNSDDHQAVTSWDSSSQGNLTLFRNGSYYNPGGTRPWASFTTTGKTFQGYAFQDVPIGTADGNTTYEFTGGYHAGSGSTSDPAFMSFYIYDKRDTANYIGKQKIQIPINGENSGWITFRVTAKPASGADTLRVAFELKRDSTSSVGASLHVRNVNLQISTCNVAQPQIDTVTPALGQRGTTVTVTLTGQNFAGSPTSSTAKLTSGSQTITASSVTVNSPTQATAIFAIPSDAKPQDYDLTYTQTDCSTPVVLSKVLTVYLSGFENGSFELPAVADCNGATETVPTSWRTAEENSWGNRGILSLDGFYSAGTLSFKPTCPTVFFGSGPGYGTMSSSASAVPHGDAYAWETVPVTAGQTYTISGFFAGSGNSTVTLALNDGGFSGTAIASKHVHTGSGNYDWTFGYVSGQAPSPGTGAMTAMWHVYREGASENASHADQLAFAQCATPVGPIESITPAVITNDQVLDATIIGTGFTQMPTAVFLTKPGAICTGVGITRPDTGHITCSFNLPGNGIPIGKYDLVIQQGGCFATLPGAVSIAAPTFVNGDFTSPTADDTACPGTDLPGLPTGWLTDHNLHRDGTYPAPACPLPDGTHHYGSMSSGTPATLRAWQTILAVPGQNYRFSGYFASNSISSIKLLSGFEDGTLISSQDVYSDTPDNSWVFKTLSGIATSNIMTAVWEIDATNGGGNAAGLQFGSSCHHVWADADDDGDVDQADFAQLQACYTGDSGMMPDLPYCVCFDVAGNSGAPDSRVSQVDLVEFERCASGPGIPVVAAGCQ